MNYRHAFHAGNFADLIKHAALLQLLRRQEGGVALTVIDTHAGRGLYDLSGPEAARSGEAKAGVARLMAEQGPPPSMQPLVEAVRRLNGGGREIRRYPGSPWLIAEQLRPGDRYLACELRAEEHAALRQALKGRRNVDAICADGYVAAAERAPPSGQVLVLIDPPFERPDDYLRIVQTVAAVRRRNSRAQLLIWLPLKDLETFDAFLRDLEDESGAPCLVAEARMRPLKDPMKMNGCALVLVSEPMGMAPVLDEICAWTTASLGEQGAARIYELSSH